jgi:dihydropteroate synthase
MGVINCSPESFYARSYIRRGSVHATAVQLIEEGAEVLDVGGRSTAPGSPPISVAEEKERVTEALRELEGCGFPLTIDTIHPGVLDAALRYGIAGVNDISGLADPQMGRLIAEQNLPAILMASVQRPGDAIGFAATIAALEGVVQRCNFHGVKEYILDPGLGRWVKERTAGDDWDLSRNFSSFLEFERPLLAAISRKSFIGDLLQKSPEERLSGSLALTVYLVEQGAAMVRTHDVVETRDVLSVCRRMRGWR